MRYKAFGSTGLQVSEMALGTWGMGGSGWDDYSEDTRLDAIRAAVECGVNFIDTAPAYNNGVAERFVGKAVKEMGVRDKVIIATKCGNDFMSATAAGTISCGSARNPCGTFRLTISTCI